MGIVCKCEEDGVLLLFFFTVVFLLMSGIIPSTFFEIDSLTIHFLSYASVTEMWQKMEMKDLKRLLKLKVLKLNSKQSLVLKNIFQFVGRQIRTDENITPPPSPNKN